MGSQKFKIAKNKNQAIIDFDGGFYYSEQLFFGTSKFIGKKIRKFANPN